MTDPFRLITAFSRAGDIRTTWSIWTLLTKLATAIDIITIRGMKDNNVDAESLELGCLLGLKKLEIIVKDGNDNFDWSLESLTMSGSAIK